MNLLNDPATVERAVRVGLMTNEYLRSKTPQEWDRNMQAHLAQARGPLANACLLAHATNFGVRLRTMQTRMARNDAR